MVRLRLRPGSSSSVGDAVTVQVITYAPTVFTHCQHCEIAFGEVGIGERVRRDEAASALPQDLALDFARLSDWVRRIIEQYGAGVHVEVIDAASVEGLLVSLRHRLWRHPAVIVDDRRIDVRTGYVAAEPAITQAIADRTRSGRAPARA